MKQEDILFDNFPVTFSSANTIHWNSYLLVYFSLFCEKVSSTKAGTFSL